MTDKMDIKLPMTDKINIELPLTWAWEPIADITAYELSLCLPYLLGKPIDSNTNLNEPHFRHFTIKYPGAPKQDGNVEYAVTKNAIDEAIDRELIERGEYPDRVRNPIYGEERELVHKVIEDLKKKYGFL